MGVKLRIKKDKPAKVSANTPKVTAGTGGVSKWHFLRNRKMFIIFACLVATLTVILVGQRIYQSTKKPPKIDRTKLSCSEDAELINNYNETVRKKGAVGLSDIKNQINQKKQAKTDITCVYMTMVAQYGDTKTTDEKDTYKEFKKLESEGKKLSEKINDNIDRELLEKTMQKEIEDAGKNYYGQG